MNRPPLLRISVLALLALAIAFGPMRSLVARGQDQPIEFGPVIVILDELKDQYEAVPFDHLSHAMMAEMWHGCETCHHFSPQVSAGSDDKATSSIQSNGRTQEESVQYPACKSCHAVTADDADIRMPGLKGAYHRQCLNCHKEWMHENACVICHAPIDSATGQAAPSPGDIVGRMHPPIPEPDEVHYQMRYTPADGGNVLFRHKEHTAEYGLRCVECHYEDNCAHCHSPSGDILTQKPLRPGMTWEESHGPCMACHSENRCKHCHYGENESPPPMFTHSVTGQLLDQDHAEIACRDCHSSLKFDSMPTCGDASCHTGEWMNYPDQLPGPVIAPTPTTTPTPPEAQEIGEVSDSAQVALGGES